MLTMKMISERGDKASHRVYGMRGGMRGRGTWAEELAGLGSRWRVGVEEEGGAQAAGRFVALVTGRLCS